MKNGARFDVSLLLLVGSLVVGSNKLPTLVALSEVYVGLRV